MHIKASQSKYPIVALVVRADRLFTQVKYADGSLSGGMHHLNENTMQDYVDKVKRSGLPILHDA